MDALRNAIIYLSDPANWKFFLEHVRGLFIVLDVIFGIWLVFVVVKALQLKPHLIIGTREEHDTRLVPKLAVFRDRWEGVKKRLEEGSAESLRLAVIEADALVDAALKDLGFEGEHMADRLGMIDEEEVKSLDGLWRAHRLRNELVHTPGFALTAHEAHEAVYSYESFLKEIGVFEEQKIAGGGEYEEDEGGPVEE